MSLVNDVLRQLDSSSSKPYQSMPLHSLMVDHPVRNHKIIGGFFILTVTLLLVLLTMQLFYSQSLASIFFSENKKLINSNAESFVLAELEEPLPLLEDIISVDILNVELADTTIRPNTDISAEIKTQEEHIVDVVTVTAVANERPKIETVKDTLIKDIPIDNDSQRANITAVANVGFKQYQLALRAYKRKQATIALSWIDLALAQEEKDEYLRLKVRILMQKDDGDALYRFVIEQGNRTSLAWFQLIAPSLQMYSYYDLSNKYYSELIKQQPNEAKWQLAMALNYSKLGLNDKTYSIYKNLLSSSLITYKQQKWIASRLERMEQGKVVNNER
jgi:hypothetical protein